METILTQPSATPLMQALRSIGYNSKTAIADLIDNSIDAKATFIDMSFQFKESDGMIVIKDNGEGMSEDELQIAMTLGSKDPREKRKVKELGRFGMGLKTAAFSLGKRLSVLTKQNNQYVERCWDLDYVSRCNEWRLFKEIPAKVKEALDNIEGESGTIVCIDKLDRFMGYGSKKVIKDSSFFRKVRNIKEHLELTFHLLLNEGLKIRMNGYEIEPWDPFLLDNPKTLEGEKQLFRIHYHKMIVSPFILPHSSNFNELEYKNAGGIKGWRDQQGFYVYREKRLLYFGGWLGMFSKDAASQLTRIRIDLENIADEDWQVDVKKSNISIPEDAKIILQRIADRYRQISREIFYFRTKSSYTGGKIKGSLNTWERIENDEGASFRLNRTHPILCGILNEVDENTARLLNVYLKSIEMGSPNNIIDVPKVTEDVVQCVDEVMKRMVVEFANIYLETKLASNLDQLINIFMTQPGFENLNYETLKYIIEEEKIFYV
ncbi:ATP-binding protein [Bacillus sp. MHSD_36]|uniref:ATP-binding protein n=1 Tax=Bacillus TaxID=1386 RepID=UPI0022E42C5A|nr:MULTISPECIES: ATP-binding protein [Bacillus]MDA1560570.1 ATP-binding protein [Bacillus cereus group sp. TH243-1LC]MDP7992222.1 ATP-binding protein [Bacillus sp. MHSD_36]MDR4980922.1 ATP-binding protein [Bacillus sp. MHSD_37]WHT90733.1 ATP-binding protein [Bacillus cereus]HDR4604108.1 ATP-binding protein [Bacillus cereus]